MATTFIYALLDPDTDEVRYIGKADNPNKRLRRHLGFFEPTATYKQNWLKSLISKQQQPSIKILEEVDKEDWQDAERKWIKHYREQGARLTNKASGGNGGWNGLSEEGRLRKNKKASERMQRLWDEIKAEHRREREAAQSDYELIETENGWSYK
jgi:hypothetical protein